MKEIFYQAAISAVSECFGASENQILRSKREECADARYVLIHFLAMRLTDNDVAELSGLPRSSVNYIKNHPRAHKYSVRAAVCTVAGLLSRSPAWNMEI